MLFLIDDLALSAFINYGTGTQFIDIHLLNSSQVEQFESITEFVEETVILFFESHCEFELSVVYNSHRCRPNSLSGNFIHEFYAHLEVREDKRCVLLYFWNVSNTNSGFSDDPVVAFMTHDQMVEIWPIRNSWPFTQLGISTLYKNLP